MSGNESLAGFRVTRMDLIRAVDIQAREDGLEGPDIGKPKSPVTGAWNAIMKHRYHSDYGVPAHADTDCTCGLEPVAQDGTTEKQVDLANLADALPVLEERGVIDPEKRQKLEDAAKLLFAVLPDIQVKFEQAAAESLDVSE